MGPEGEHDSGSARVHSTGCAKNPSFEKTSDIEWGQMRRQRAYLFFACLILSAAVVVCESQGRSQAGPQGGSKRPPIIGIAHIGLETNDIAAAREFYRHGLGYQELFSLDKPGGSLMLTCFKVNDQQYMEIFPDLKSETQDRLSHIAFETTDIRQLRDYLLRRGVNVPQTVALGRDGNASMMLKDADGHNVEFVQYIPGSLHSRNFGKFLPGTRVSQHMIHVGVTVQDRAAADHFYKDILGFQMTWYGGMNDDRTDWVDMRVPDGTDWLEYMLNVHNPSPKQLGVMHHLALGVQNIRDAYQTVLARGIKPPQPPKIGRDGKWQLNLYDPNDTRTELMEFKPVQAPCCSSFLSATVKPLALGRIAVR
jgi:catechol 2,3-dioxygenase-like lactoylglutathione lyase family enzyme